MKLSNVLISNLATFPYIPDLATAPGTSFDIHDIGAIHIFIGPNGAGKSVFLDIIQQACSTVFFQPYSCSIKDIANLSYENNTKIIHSVAHPIHSLHENKTGKDKPSHIFITFALNELDRNNIAFIYKHQKECNELIEKYSSETIRFNYSGIEEYIHSCDEIVCKVQVDTHTNTAWRMNEGASEGEKFVYDFFTYFHLLQHCIAIHNALYPQDDQHWHALHATFATIGSYRNLLHYKDTYTIGVDEVDHFAHVLHDATLSSIKTSQDHLTGLLYVKKKIATYLFKKNPDATDAQIQELLNDASLYQALNRFCKKYLRRSLVVKMTDTNPHTYLFGFTDNEGNIYYLDELSAGEKSMLGIVCAVYGYGLDKGLLVIDEPELHLHPQLQKQFLALIEDLSNYYGMQCIMTTHSSLMINDKNIKHVYRFHTDKGVTHIVTPGENYTEDAGKLMQILKFTNTAKIFFVKKIIMVEGETDEFAFGNYLQYLAKHDPKWSDKMRDYEIVNINGKGGYARRKKFLNSFGIQNYFIGDRDNIQDTGNQPVDMHYYENRMRRSRGIGGYISKSEKYKGIIQFLKTKEPKHRDEIVGNISQLYKKHIYILQQGDIEAYLGMREKGLEETVQFFQTQFSHWMHDSRFDDERKELDAIFTMIFDS